MKFLKTSALTLILALSSVSIYSPALASSLRPLHTRGEGNNQRPYMSSSQLGCQDQQQMLGMAMDKMDAMQQPVQCPKKTGIDRPTYTRGAMHTPAVNRQMQVDCATDAVQMPAHCPKKAGIDRPTYTRGAMYTPAANRQMQVDCAMDAVQEPTHCQTKAGIDRPTYTRGAMHTPAANRQMQVDCANESQQEKDMQ